MKKANNHHLKNLILLLLISISLLGISLNTHASCTQNSYGDHCVIYVRNYFENDYSLMPALCQYNADCGAYNAWGHWDLGFGSGSSPQDNSIMVLNKTSGLPVGHIVVVVNQNKNSDGTYSLSVNESNWDGDKLVDCNVDYTFYPIDSTVSREGVGRYPVLGFIYSNEPSNGSDDKPDLVVREIYLTDHRATFYIGESFRIHTRIKNDGDGDVSHDIRMEYYLSKGTKVDDDPIDIWHDDIEKEKLEAGESEWEDKGVTAPSEPGTYNITVCADTNNEIDEEHESNNCYDSPIVFEVIDNPTPQVPVEALITIINNLILTEDEIIPGDVNGDKNVTISDAIVTLKVSCGDAWNGSINIHADVNKDNKVGLAEAIYILQKAANLRDE